MAKKNYSPELCTELERIAHDPRLEITHRPARYENGTVLPIDITGAQLKWDFSNDMSVASDDMDYHYRFTFELSHTPFCFTGCN